MPKNAALHIGLNMIFEVFIAIKIHVVVFLDYDIVL